MELYDEEGMGFWWWQRVYGRIEESLIKNVDVSRTDVCGRGHLAISNILHSEYRDSLILCNMPQNDPNGFSIKI